jgi:hypothetical protein
MPDWIDPARKEFQRYRRLAEGAFAQVNDQEFFLASHSESNSIAVVAKHVGGNLRSRWTDFLTSDGEKADRNRESEFTAQADRQEILQIWNAGWAAVLHTLDSLRPEDLEKTITIRGEALTIPQAVLRSLAHTANHAGQIITLARQFRGNEWRNLSMPRQARGST